MDTQSSTARSPVIWITGASSGIGKALLQFYAEHHPDWQLIASARNLDTVKKELSQFNNISYIPIDVCDETTLASAQQAIQQRFHYLSHVIVNAGICEYSDDIPFDMHSLNKVMEVNFYGSVNTINAAIPLLKASPIQRQVIGINSQVVFAPFARAEFYGASKAAFDYFLKSLRIDLSKHQIDVKTIYPGFVKTPLTDKNTFDMPFIVPVDKAARLIAKAIDSNKQRYIFPKSLHCLLWLHHLMPKTWQKMSLKDQEKSASTSKLKPEL